LVVVGPEHRLTDERINNDIAPALLQAGNELSKRLGFPG
jgi:DNA-binding IclR family transcriptional regulator